MSEDGPDFISELRDLLNKHSMENGSDTPDYMLARYLCKQLSVFNETIKAREVWYGRKEEEAVCGDRVPSENEEIG